MELQNWVASEISRELRAFLDVDERVLFEDDMHELLHAMACESISHKRVDGNLVEDKRAPAFMFLEDSVLVTEIGTFVDELEHWLRKIDEIRRQWFWDHITNELPENYLSVFGHTSPAVMKLARIKNRGRRIFELLDRRIPTEVEHDDRKAKAVRLWNANPGITWRKVAEQVDPNMQHDSASVDAFKKEIVRYAEKNRISLRKGKPGAKKTP